MEDELIRALRVKGRGTVEALSAFVGGDVDVALTVESLTASGLAEETRLGLRLTEQGKARALELFAADRAALADAGDPLYEAFAEVNDAVKQIVTDWQLRAVGGQQVVNDHSDAAYDQALIARLAEAHRAVTPTLVALAECATRYARYHDRLAAALAAIDAGDTAFVASPAKDSYHTVWFELHEDLILATARTRAEESLAGRG